MSRFVVIDRTGEIITDFSFGSGDDTILRLWDDVAADYDVLDVNDYEEVTINGTNYFKPKVKQYSLNLPDNCKIADFDDFWKPYDDSQKANKCQHRNVKKVDMIYTTIKVCIDCKEEVI